MAFISGQARPDLDFYLRVLSAPPRPATISLAMTPSTALLPTGFRHVVTATSKDADGIAVVGAPVDFSVAENNPAVFNSLTDRHGQSQFSFVGNNAGVDTIRAAALAAGQSVLSNDTAVDINAFRFPLVR